MVAHTFNPALWRQEQLDLEFQASLVDRAGSRTAWATKGFLKTKITTTTIIKGKGARHAGKCL